MSIKDRLAIFAWAGFIIGPVLAITAGFVSICEEKRSDVWESDKKDISDNEHSEMDQ